MCFFSTLTIIYCRHSWNITFPFRTANFLRQFKTNVLETTLWIIKTEISNLVSRARYWNNLQISSEWKDSFIVKIRLPYEYHGMCLIRDMNWLSFARSWVQPRMLVMFTHAPVFNPGCWWCSHTLLCSTPDVGDVHIAHRVTFLYCVFCFACLPPISCVASCYGLSIIDCTFNFL